MPLGDSITHGDGGYASYRYWLAKRLDQAGVAYDFVGSMQGSYRGTPRFTDFDGDHEGHSGWRADQILTGLSYWLQKNPADIVLLHIGSNDLLQGQDIDETAVEIEMIIRGLQSRQPGIVILVAQVIPGKPIRAQVKQLNRLLPDVVGRTHSEQQPVLLVDQWTGFDDRVHTYDGLHATESGEKRIARRWYEALQALPAVSATMPQ